MHGVSALPPDSPQVPQQQAPQHKPSPNNVLPPKPAHLAAQAAAAASSFRQKKPPMPSPPLSSPPATKVDQEVRYHEHKFHFKTRRNNYFQHDVHTIFHNFIFFTLVSFSHICKYSQIKLQTF